MQAIIDDTYDEQELKDFFRDLSMPINWGKYSGYDSIGQFGGTYSEVVALRNRVIRRLVIVDQCKELFQQLKHEMGVAA